MNLNQHAMAKYVLLMLGLFSANLATGQTDAIPAAVFTFDGMRQSKIVGSTTFYETFEVEILDLSPGKKKRLSTTKDVEELLIIKDGQLEIELAGKVTSVGPGSIAFVMPEEKYTVLPKSTSSALVYRLTFKSKNPVDRIRGQRNGGSFVIDWKTLVMKENERGGRWDFFNKPTATCVNYEMHVSMLHEGLPSHPPHTHPAEEIILLTKGDAVMSIDNKEYTGSAGDLFFLPAESLHGITNAGKGQCEYFAFQWR